MRILLEAAQGMLYLHSMSPALLLRDLKSANLLVTRDWTVKVTARPVSCLVPQLIAFLQCIHRAKDKRVLSTHCCQLML